MTRHVAIGALWMVLFKVIERGISLVSTLILARLLLPRDFGIVAMGTSVIALMELFSAFGLETALIQRRNVGDHHYNTAWTMNVIAGVVVGALMMAIAVPASHFYREPDLVLVIALLGLCAIVQGMENVRVVDFRRNLDFDREFRFLLAKKLIAFAAVLPLAFWMRSFWALVIGMLTARIVVLAYSYAVRPSRPHFTLSAARELMSFSLWMVALNLLAFLRERSGDFVIGRMAGSRALGTFGIASQLASLPSTELVAPVNRALLPAYAKLADDLPALARQYLNAMGVISTVAVPAVVGMAAAAPFIVRLLLGPAWNDAVAVLEVLAFFGITQVLQTNAYSAFLAIGKPGVFVRINAFHVVLLMVGLVLFTPTHGMLGAAWAYVISALLALPVNFVFISRYMGIKVRELCSVVWRPLAASAVMYATVRYAGPPPPEGSMSSLHALLPLLWVASMGAGVYVATSFLLWVSAGRPQGAERWLVEQVLAISRRSGLVR